jgi:hypothetical protein
MAKEKFEVGKHVAVHQDYVGSDDCFVCGKELKESDVEVRVALTENHTLSTLDSIIVEWYSLDWSPRVGSDCLKRFPQESIFSVYADGRIETNY